MPRGKRLVEVCFRCGKTVSDQEAWYLWSRRDPHTGNVRLLSEEEYADIRERGTARERHQLIRRFGFGFACVCLTCADELNLSRGRPHGAWLRSPEEVPLA
jgi:hypothetical protein